MRNDRKEFNLEVEFRCPPGVKPELRKLEGETMDKLFAPISQPLRLNPREQLFAILGSIATVVLVFTIALSW